MATRLELGASCRGEYDNGTVTIKSGAMNAYDEGGILPQYKSSMISLKLFDYGELSLRNIGENSFYNYPNLEGIYFGTTETQTIDKQAFYYCPKLTSIEGFSSLSKLTTIGDSAFYNCQDLKSIAFPSNIQTIGKYAFYSMATKSSFKQSLDLPASLTSVGDYAFGSAKIGDVTIRGKISSISTKAFDGCYLNTIKLPNFESSGEKLSSLAALEGVDENTYIITDKLNGYLIMSGSTVTGFKGFYNGVPVGGMSSSISAPTYSSIANVLGIDKSAIINIKFPSDTTKIGTGAFLDCTNLKTATQMDSVTSIENGAFSGCTGLTVTIPSTVTSIGNYAFKDVAHVYYSGKAEGAPWGAKAYN